MPRGGEPQPPPLIEPGGPRGAASPSGGVVKTSCARVNSFPACAQAAKERNEKANKTKTHIMKNHFGKAHLALALVAGLGLWIPTGLAADSVWLESGGGTGIFGSDLDGD